jgi:hypothetical protein
MFKHVPAEREVLLVAEVLLVDGRTQVVEVALADLLGREFWIGRGVLGTLELMSFHFSPK